MDDRDRFEEYLTAHLPAEAPGWQWTSFEEYDWKRFNELRIRELLQNRARHGNQAQECHCIECPNFVKHVGYQSINIA